MPAAPHSDTEAVEFLQMGASNTESTLGLKFRKDCHDNDYMPRAQQLGFTCFFFVVVCQEILF